MQRIKEEHEQQLDMMEQTKDRELLEVRQQCETQVQDLTQDFTERLDDLKTELDQLRERLALEERDAKHLRDGLSEKEVHLSTLRGELEDSKEHESRLRARLEDMRDTNNSTEKRLLEQTMLKEQAIRDSERFQDQVEGLKRENDRQDQVI